MEKRFRMSRIFRVILAMVLILGVALFMFACMDKSPESPVSKPKDLTVFPQGTTISGENISGKTVDEALEAGKAYLDTVKEKTEISIKFGDDNVMLKGNDFETSDILEQQIPELLAAGQAGEYDISYVIDLSKEGKEKIFAAAKTTYKAGKNATVEKYDSDSGSFVFTDGEKGSRADINKTFKSIRQMLSQKTGGNLQAQFMEVLPKTSKEELAENFVRLSAFSTVSSNTSNGNSNMALALSRINGTVLEPGQVFSYNDSIGNSTSTDDGYLPAGGIMSGILIDVIGGGICQGSSTLYNSVIRAGLEIVERECHGKESTYIATGLDAAVDYGNIDFRFRNNLENPIYLMCWMDGTTLNTSIYGVQPEEWDNIEVYSERTGTIAALSTVSFVKDPNLGEGSYERRSSGTTGAQSIASRTFYKNGEVVRREDLPSSYYPPTGIIFAHGPNTDTSKIDTGSAGGGTAATPKPGPNPTPPPTSSGTEGPSDPTPSPPDDPTPPPVTPTPEPTPEPTPPPISWPDLDD